MLDAKVDTRAAGLSFQFKQGFATNQVKQKKDECDTIRCREQNNKLLAVQLCEMLMMLPACPEFC